VENKVECKE